MPFFQIAKIPENNKNLRGISAIHFHWFCVALYTLGTYLTSAVLLKGTSTEALSTETQMLP